MVGLPGYLVNRNSSGTPSKPTRSVRVSPSEWLESGHPPKNRPAIANRSCWQIAWKRSKGWTRLYRSKPWRRCSGSGPTGSGGSSGQDDCRTGSETTYMDSVRTWNGRKWPWGHL